MDSDEEELVAYGTPLPEIDDDVILKKKANQELEVRDEKGRQRFHGAFTGGFSAGYFNTVGTKEGWAPSSFVSSRTKRPATQIEQNPEDFMDDEDFGEFGIAPKKIHTTSHFQDEDQIFSKKQKHVFNPDAAIPGAPPLKDLVKPVVESIGMKILKKLGWKQGQGIGPRLEKQDKENAKVYGCSLGPLQHKANDGDEEEEGDPMFSMFTLAPKDVTAVPYVPKDNYHGLGYSGLSTKSVLSAPVDEFAPTFTKSWLEKDKRKLTITGQAFGVGAFEEEDDDIYSKDDMSQYDFSELLHPNRNKSGKSSSEIKTTKSDFKSQMLQDFHLASKTSYTKKYYPPPNVPTDFRPRHKFSRFSEVPSSSNHFRSKMTAVDRAVLLGEKKFEKPAAIHKQPDEGNKKSSDNYADNKLTEKISATTSNTSFKPFAKDASKQQRYEEYLRLRKNNEPIKLLQPSSMTEWEKQQELEEFSRVATFYQPVSTILSSRFESLSQLSMEHDVMKSYQELKAKKEKEESISSEKGSSECVKRETFAWHPASLLCRRFNVQNPYPNSTNPGVQHMTKSKSSIFDCLLQSVKNVKETDFPSGSDDFTKPTAEVESSADSNAFTEKCDNGKNMDTSSSSSQVENKPEGNENSRPPMDLFKDIFASSSSEDSAGSDNEASDKSAAPASAKSETVIEPSSSEHNLQTSNNENTLRTTHTNSTQNKAFGVFANLDLDALNRRTTVKDKKVIKNEGEKTVEDNQNTRLSPDIAKTDGEKSNIATDKLQESDSSYYGPELPPPGVAALSDSGNAVDRYKLKKKHKHKHKHHKHKSKKRKKEKIKYSKKDDSSSSSDDDGDDIPPTIILEKLKKLEQKGKLPLEKK